MSSVRQQQLLADRQLTRAISIFLQERREELLAQLNLALVKGAQAKRHELLRLARKTFKMLPDTAQSGYLQAASPKSAPSTSAPTLPTSGAASSSPEDDFNDAQLEDVDGAELEDGAQDGGQDGAHLEDVDGVREFGCSGSVDQGLKSAKDDDLVDALQEMLGMVPLTSSRQGSHLDEEPLSVVDPPPVVRRRIREKRADMAYPAPEAAPPPLVPSSGCSGESMPPSSLPPAPPLLSSDRSGKAMPPPRTPAPAPLPDKSPPTICAPAVRRFLTPWSGRSGVQSSGVESAGVESAGVQRTSGDERSSGVESAGVQNSGVENAEDSDDASEESSGSEDASEEPEPTEPSLRARMMDIDTQRHLRKQLGDAGCMEVLAVSYRILDVVEAALMHMPGAVAMKLAALVGIAAKYAGAPAYTGKGVEKLWVQIAGRVSWQDIRELEAKIVTMWSKPVL